MVVGGEPGRRAAACPPFARAAVSGPRGAEAGTPSGPDGATRRSDDAGRGSLPGRGGCRSAGRGTCGGASGRRASADPADGAFGSAACGGTARRSPSEPPGCSPFGRAGRGSRGAVCGAFSGPCGAFSGRCGAPGRPSGIGGTACRSPDAGRRAAADVPGCASPRGGTEAWRGSPSRDGRRAGGAPSGRRGSGARAGGAGAACVSGGTRSPCAGVPGSCSGGSRLRRPDGRCGRCAGGIRAEWGASWWRGAGRRSGSSGPGGRCASVLIRPPGSMSTYTNGSPLGAGPFVTACASLYGLRHPPRHRDPASVGICPKRPPTPG